LPLLRELRGRWTADAVDAAPVHWPGAVVSGGGMGSEGGTRLSARVQRVPRDVVSGETRLSSPVQRVSGTVADSSETSSGEGTHLSSRVQRVSKGVAGNGETDSAGVVQRKAEPASGPPTHGQRPSVTIRQNAIQPSAIQRKTIQESPAVPETEVESRKPCAPVAFRGCGGSEATRAPAGSATRLMTRPRPGASTYTAPTITSATMVQRSIAPFAGTASATSAPGSISPPVRSRPIVQLREHEPRILQRAALASAGLAPAVIQRSPSDDGVRAAQESASAPTESVIEQRAQPEAQAMAQADDLADEAMRKMLRRLAIERERKGGRRWL
jgi:hypothetical protein